jgi:ligand-binding SRPBCC domain-containing protein
MPFIHLTTFIGAPQERVFDLSRSVDLHKYSMTSYRESAINGTITGLMGLGDQVTWKAKHLWKERILQVKLTQYKRPDYFADEQVNGDFLLMKHEHYFRQIENGTIMIDQFRYEIPYGKMGQMVNSFYLEKYMTRLLEQRNAVIKKVAESNQWKQFLNE